MVTMYTAHTSEVDEIDDALREIKSQIDFTALKKHSGALIFCHTDYIESGVVEAICGALPFDVIGMTSMISADEHGYSPYDLSLTILTSDDVRFFAGTTENLEPGSYTEQIGRLYADLRERAGRDPAMIFTFIPYMRDVSGQEITWALDASCGGIPLWGSIASGVNFDYENTLTICNGKGRDKGVAMLFADGPVTPTFIVSSLPEGHIANNRAIITKSQGSILHEVNNLPAQRYFADAGLTVTKDNLSAMPVMVYYEKETAPVALGFYTLFDDGSLLAGGTMPEGAAIAMGSIDQDGILQSAKDGLAQILAASGRKTTLLLPCISRYVMLTPNQESEIKLISEQLTASGKPFMMGYAGGEICPILGKDGVYRNHFHNYSFCACIL